MERAGNGADGWEAAVLDGGPAGGVRIRVAGRPRVVQVSCPCPLDDEAGTTGVRVDALHIYRRTSRAGDTPLRYGFDAASP
ncbi:hypothetical protein [Streptomyces sp. NPDC008317]|uniref:hypothetical protein n=1 Tax=Streptomyces sp. NPDC008317 TaxID=3364827 RepID=UPI0036E58EBB